MSEYLRVTNNKSKNIYKINNIKDYVVEQDIEVPADHFQFVVGNKGYKISNAIGAGDKLEFYIDGKKTLTGYIDDVNVGYNIGDNDVVITGRDLMSVLLDNDATPKTYKNLGLKGYMDKVLPKYGITSYSSSNNKKFDKIVIEPGENEYSVIERLSKERGIKPLYLPDGSFRCTYLNMNRVVKTKSSTPPKLKTGNRAKVTKSNAPAFRDSYGKTARPWAEQARAAGISYGQLLYIVNMRGNYVALGKVRSVSSAIAWVRKSDVTPEGAEKNTSSVGPASSDSNYLFSNDANEKKAIRIKELDVNISADIVNEVVVYGGEYENNKSITGSYKDNKLQISKKRIINASDIENNNDAKKRAKEEFYEINKDALVITIATTTKQPILINNSARVKIKDMGLNALMLVYSVKYEKSVDKGSITIITLKMMQGISVNFKNNTIPTLPILVE